MKLGRTYLALGEPDRALKALAPVQALYPDLPWPHLIAGEALLAKGAPARRSAPLRASLATNPFDPRVHCALADAYGKLPPSDRPPGRDARPRAGLLPQPRADADVTARARLAAPPRELRQPPVDNR